ncbi:MAG: hypothetical protein LC789_02700 [Actinobacteria bacterium]|nr:hypothetical protein [Actinomycetota bacterium]MCA1722396.1 hypothetical protein [Actinomycetota bacterium]
MRSAPRVLLGLCLTGAAVLGPAVPALAAGSGTATVKPTAEAWYRSTPACTLPTGCADLGATPSPYPADTLHVGVNAGMEEARTYLQLDLGKLPAGTKPSGGTLLLPVASSNDGTRAPETAKMRACAVKAAVTDVDGSFGKPPEANCEAASAPATFVPAAGANPAAFTVDLAALTAAWEDDMRAGALVLLPAKSTAAPDSWHVALSDRTRTGTGIVPISAALAFVSTSFDTDTAESPTVAPPAFESSPAFTSGSAPAGLEAGTSFAAPPFSAAAPLLPAPTVRQAAPAAVAAAPVQRQLVPVASVVQGGFRYPGVFLLPLLLAVSAAWLGRALTRELIAA